MKRRIALVEPYITSGKSLGIEKSPESIQMLAGQLEGAGYNVKMFHQKADEQLCGEIKAFKPYLVGISTMTANFPEGQKLAEEVKRINSETHTILGGWHSSGIINAHLTGQESETIREALHPKSSIDYLVAGEGDILLPEMAKRLSDGQSVYDLKGVGYIDKNGQVHASVAERIQKLDDLADPSWKDLDLDKYRDKRAPEGERGKLDLSVHFNRACRFNCGFCSTGTVYGKGVRAFSPERSIEYLTSLLNKFGPEVVTYTDEDFFANPKWVKEIVKLTKQQNLKEKYNVGFDTFASINDLNRFEKRGEGNFLDEMREAGFNSFTIGVESFNPNILRAYNKELMILPMMSNEQRQRYNESYGAEKDKTLVDFYFNKTQGAINFAQDHGILVCGDYIVGNLGETEKQVREGFGKFSDLENLPIAYIPAFTPFPGTKEWGRYYESGKIKRNTKGNINWSKFNASEGPVDLGYDVGLLRNKLEIEFYTSQRYKQDMFKAIKQNPQIKPLFQGRFNHLNKTFPESEQIKQGLVELGKL